MDADVKLERNGEEIMVSPLNTKGVEVMRSLFDEPELTIAYVVHTDMPLMELLSKLNTCIIAMVDDEDPSKIYYVDNTTGGLH